MDVSEFPSSEAEFRGRFADDNRCREYLARLKWPEGFRCAHCAGDRAYFLPSKRVVYECADCGRQVSVIAGTILAQSKKPLALWFRAIFEVTASKQGISAAELQRKLGLGSYQTAWSWLTKIRTAMVRPNREPLAGEVEIDESYVGGPEPGQPGRAAEDKAIVAAAVEKRGKSCGRLRLGVIANVSADVLTAFVDNHLADGETAHWCTFGSAGTEPRSGVVFADPSACRDGLSRLPLVGPCETRRAAGAGRFGRTTGCRAKGGSPERLSMSDPHDLPARRSLTQPGGPDLWDITQVWIGAAPCMPSASSTRPVASSSVSMCATMPKASPS